MTKRQQQAQTETAPEELGGTVGLPPHPSSNAVALAHAYTPPELLHLAIMKKSDITVIERMSALAERWQETAIKREQRLAFINAMVDAKMEMPILTKNRRVHFKSNKAGAADTDYWHEDLAMVVETAQPVLAKHGLTFRWRTKQPEPGVVTVTCVLEHRGGHAEENELTAGVDLSGNKNHIQAIKSAATYLERFTALAIVGLAAKGQDDDGRMGGKPQEPVEVITAEQAHEIRMLLPTKGRSEAAFCKWAGGISKIEELEASLYEDALAQTRKLKDVETKR